MSTLVHAAAISEPNSAGEPWLSDEPFRDVYVQRNVKTLRERFQSLKKGDWKLKEEKSPRENHVTFAGVFPDVQISRRLPAVGSERRSVDVPFALRFSSSSKPRRRRMVGVYDDQAARESEWRRSPASHGRRRRGRSLTTSQQRRWRGPGNDRRALIGSTLCC